MTSANPFRPNPKRILLRMALTCAALLMLSGALAQLPAQQLQRADNLAIATLRFSLSSFPDISLATDIRINGADVVGMSLFHQSGEARIEIAPQSDSLVRGSEVTFVIDGTDHSFSTGPYEIAWFDHSLAGSLAFTETRTQHRNPRVEAYVIENQGSSDISLQRLRYAASAAATGKVLFGEPGTGPIQDADLPYDADPAAPFDPDQWEGQQYTKRDASDLDVVLTPGQRLAIVIGGEAFVDPESFATGALWDFAPWIEYEEEGELRRLILPSYSYVVTDD